MAQITTITSEALQAAIRRLLPSQRGFGEDLQATNVITPIIDITPTAEGSILREDLQRAIDFNVTNIATGPSTTNVLSSTAGFYQLQIDMRNAGAVVRGSSLQIDNGITSKVVYQFNMLSGTQYNFIVPIIFVAVGHSLKRVNGADINSNDVLRQIADVNGNLVNPEGFTSE